MYNIIDNVLRPPRRMEISGLLERRRLGTWECTRQAEPIERAEGTHDASQSPIDSRQTLCKKNKGQGIQLPKVERLGIVSLDSRENNGDDAPGCRR